MVRESDITICGHGSGTPSYKNMYEYNCKRASWTLSNGLDKGLVCVRRFKGLTAAAREAWKQAYASIIGRNIYDQDLREYVFTPYKGTYYSDCSSSICGALRQIGYDIDFLNTAGMYKSDLFEDVPVTIVNGHVLDPEKLRPVDILLYRGNTSRPKYIGHVEAVYSTPAEETDDGSTTLEDDNMKSYKLRTVMIKDGQGMTGGDVLLVQEILNARGYKGRDGRPLVLDGDTGDNYEKSNTMYAIATYIKERAAEGVDLGDPNGWGPLCWADQALPEA